MVQRLSGARAQAPDVVEGLQRDGVVIVEAAFGAGVLVACRDALAGILPATPTGRNPFEGLRSRRVYSLLAKTRAFDPVVLHPLLLAVCDAVLRDYWISATVAIAHGPGEDAQAVHHDDAIYPLPRPHVDVMVSTLWALDDFTVANGATVLYPGSHRSPAPPPPETAPEHAEMPAGSVAIYLGTFWHGAGANTTERERVGVTFEYLAGWLRQQENQTVAIPPAAAADRPPRLRELLGYSVYPPFMGYVDGRDPGRLVPGTAAPAPSRRA